MNGIRVVEVAAWTYVPVAGAVLAEWGADVLKIEHPESGDPQRGLVTSGLIPAGAVNHMFELPNHGKRSVALDLKSEQGHELLMKLVESADVFLTNFRPSARKKLGIEVEDVRAHNDKIIYVRGSAAGQQGPESERGGYDMASFWSRSGAADNVSPDSLGYPVNMPGPAFGDVMGGLTIAGAISTALFHRERTGEALVVDSSLLALGAWAMGPTIAGAHAFNVDVYPKKTPDEAANPLVNTYRTKDGRHISIVMLESDRFWPELMTALETPQLIADPRFDSHAKRAQNNVECIKAIADGFATKTLEELKISFKDLNGVWAIVQRPREVITDPQVEANHYVADVEDSSGVPFKLVNTPIQFNEQPGGVRRAPDHGEHTDEVLAELGLSMDEILEYKISGAVL
ncbi:CoA transferase [Rhodococcus oxybenzonivorans]|uniref:CaiB/BaiF CoA transferase family protein n=1 Tax=Rhodococcus oxybenzonivorans TaxID=1990687 RepID=UPI0029552639|nr:CoA transferase [Rhodococcus oxybenzonivorans]MDV7352773.1 CoA transferase [Rhodococcus oxybenzonivorans]